MPTNPIAIPKQTNKSGPPVTMVVRIAFFSFIKFRDLPSKNGINHQTWEIVGIEHLIFASPQSLRLIRNWFVSILGYRSLSNQSDGI